MDNMRWMVNPAGSSKRINIGDIPKKEREGWKILPTSHLNEMGEPKQGYWPQYDMGYTKGEKIQILGDEEIGQLLETEVL